MLPCIARSTDPLLPHQKRFVKAFIQSSGRAGIAIHSVGSGKTKLAIAASKCFLDMYPAGRVMLITQSSLIAGFRDELAAYEKGRGGDLAKYEFYTYTSFSMAWARGDISTCAGVLVIIDEAQFFRNEAGKIYRDVHACTAEAKKVLLLSATPIVNSEVDIAALVVMATGQPAIDKATALKILESPKLSRAFFGCLLSFYRPDPAGVRAFFPRKEERVVPVVMGPATLKTYKNLMADKTTADIRSMFHLVGDEENKDLQSFYSGVRRLSASCAEKVEWIVGYVKHVISGRTNAALGITRATLATHSPRFVIFSHFREHGSRRIMAELRKLGIGCDVIDGAQPRTKRAQIVKDYLSGRIPVVLISQAGATGLNLKRTGYVIHAEPSWNLSMTEQVSARGIRFKSHIDLPQKLRNVLVLRLVLIRPDERAKFAALTTDKLRYEEQAEPPSVEIKILVDALRKQYAIDARLKMLEETIPGIEDCATKRLVAADFARMRTYRRTSAKIAAVPAGVRRGAGPYAAAPRQVEPADATSLNDALLRDVVAGSGVLRFAEPTAVLFAGNTDLIMPSFASTNVRPTAAATPGKKYRVGVVNFGINFRTGMRITAADDTIRHTMKAVNAVCDLVIVIAADSKRPLLKELMKCRSFSESTYVSDFDKALMGGDAGLVVLAC